jgi:hypothetical protein
MKHDANFFCLGKAFLRLWYLVLTAKIPDRISHFMSKSSGNVTAEIFYRITVICFSPLSPFQSQHKHLTMLT